MTFNNLILQWGTYQIENGSGLCEVQFPIVFNSVKSLCACKASTGTNSPTTSGGYYVGFVKLTNSKFETALYNSTSEINLVHYIVIGT